MWTDFMHLQNCVKGNQSSRLAGPQNTAMSLKIFLRIVSLILLYSAVIGLIKAGDK